MQNDDAFGHWFAGLVDGEGSFWIQRQRKSHAALACRFEIGLRADDRPVLELVREGLGFGYLRDHVTGRSGCRVCRYIVTAKRDCAALTAFLDRYPLRPKKARDFALWREAVRLWGECRGTRWCEFDWSGIGDIRDALMASRAFSTEVVSSG